MSLSASTAIPSRAPKKAVIAIGAGLLVLLLIGILLLAFHWPLTQAAVVKSLQKQTSSRIEIKAFHNAYFPSPGCTAEDVVFHKSGDPNGVSFITVQKLTLRSSFFGLLHKHISEFRAEGAHVTVIPGTKLNQQQNSGVVIDHLQADGAVVEFLSRKPDKAPLKFLFNQLSLQNVGGSGPISYQTRLANPEPPGEIVASGQLGPLNLADSSKTPFSGDYTFRDADLGKFGGVSGKLFSQGKFQGTLAHINIEGNTDTPDFEVTHSGHSQRLGTQFKAYVDGQNGDTFLQSVESRIGKTTVFWTGKVAGEKGKKGKFTSLELSARNGRIEDLLRMFVTADQPPMQGAISFKGTALLPPGERPFLNKLEMDGVFGIDAGRFTKPETQHGVNKLSEESESDEVVKAEKKAKSDKKKGKVKDDEENEDANAPLALSDIKGSVVMRNALATFTKLSFTIPGATAEVHGTYNLISQVVDLHGQLKMDSELSKTTHGLKSLLLKPLDPFFKKKGGSLIPVKVGGTFKHPTFGLDLAKD
ncbi:MAG: hypothetical protein NVS1B11_14100 [Terriglobales bacterium]